MTSDLSETEMLTVMLAKLIDALMRRGTELDGNWGYPEYLSELREMRVALEGTKALQKYPRQVFIP